MRTACAVWHACMHSFIHSQSGVAGCSDNCYKTESPENNFIAVRHMPNSEMGDTLYAEFQTGA